MMPAHLTNFHSRVTSRGWGIGIIFCLFGAVTLAQSDNAKDNAAPEEKTRTEIHFKSVIPGKQFLEIPVVEKVTESQSKESIIGIVRDLLIDVRSADVTFVVIEDVQSADGALWVLPLAAGKIQQVGTEPQSYTVSSKELEAIKSTPFKADALPVKEDQATVWLQAFQIEPPWLKEANLSQPAQFSSLRALYGQQVHNSDGKVLGQITELVLDPEQQRLAYTLLTLQPASNSGEVSPQDQAPRLVVPLSAYVNSGQPRTWVLDLPEEELSVEKRIGVQTFPHELPRSWIEYVSVRYGADVEKGIQPEKKKSSKE